jgi:dipeptidyl aminopeptidase/acylaminoacyl peptidase
MIDASRLAVVGISHGGFLTTHLIGQVSARTYFRTVSDIIKIFPPPVSCS